MTDDLEKKMEPEISEAADKAEEIIKEEVSAVEEKAAEAVKETAEATAETAAAAATAVTAAATKEAEAAATPMRRLRPSSRRRDRRRPLNRLWSMHALRSTDPSPRQSISGSHF